MWIDVMLTAVCHSAPIVTVFVSNIIACLKPQYSAADTNTAQLRATAISCLATLATYRLALHKCKAVLLSYT